jgi:hypothetical protein
MKRSMKVNLKLGLLTAVLAMALNVSQLSAQTYYGSSTIGIRYTNLVAFSSPALGSSACYLAYNKDFGNWEIGTIATVSPNNNLVNKQAGSGPSPWTGWTQMSSFNVGTTPFYVQYNNSTGRLQINQVEPDCASTQTVFDTAFQGTTVLPPSLTQVVAMNGPDGKPLLLAYDNTQTWLQLYVIETNSMHVPSGLALGNKPFALGAGYTSLMPYNFNGSPCFIAYSGLNGFTEFIQLTPLTLNTYNLTDVGNQPWGTGWVAVVPALTTQQFLAYSRSNPHVNPAGGVIAFDVITVNNGVQSAQNFNWIAGLDTNVSLFAPFYIQDVDNSGTPTIPGFVSYYQDSGQIQVWAF